MAELGFKLSLASDPSVLSQVRRELTTLLAAVELDPHVASDVQVAVSEACANVVRHAYEAGEGMLRVEARVRDRTIVVTVSDQGVGIVPRAEPPAHWDGLGLGLGLPLIASLAHKVDIRTAPGRGTTLRLSFDRVARER